MGEAEESELKKSKKCAVGVIEVEDVRVDQVSGRPAALEEWGSRQAVWSTRPAGRACPVSPGLGWEWGHQGSVSVTTDIYFSMKKLI